MSTRTQIFKRFPRTGIPDEFESPEHMKAFVDLLVRTNCIDDGKRLWWDVRAHHLYDTVEVRICDMPTNMEHTLTIVALVQALMAKLYLMYRKNTAWRTYTRALIEENKWRALRFGTDAQMIDFGQKQERAFSELAEELIDLVDETAAIFGTREQIAKLRDIVKHGTSAHHQIAVFEQSKDLRAVVDWLMRETMQGI